MVVPLPVFFWVLICDYKVWNNTDGLKKRLRLYSIPLIINTIFVPFTPHHRLTFYLDAGNIYQRGALVSLTWIVTWSFVIITYCLLIIKTKNKPALPFKGMNTYYYTFQLVPVVFSVIQILFLARSLSAWV